MKTAMQQLIEQLQDEINEFSVLGEEHTQYHAGYISAIRDLKEGCEGLLKVEKEQLIIFAFDFYYTMSHKNGVPENKISENRDHAEIYFNKVLIPTPHQ